MRVLILALVCSFCAASALAGPFVNGSFEDPVLPANGRVDYTIPTGWTTYTNGTSNPQMLRYDDGSVPIPDGVQYTQMQALTAGSLAGFYQTFDAVPGATYTIQCELRPLAGDVWTRVGVDPMGGTARPSVWGAELSGAVSQMWAPFSFQVTAQATSMTIFLDVESPRAAKAGAFDKIMIPEPGSMLALLSGLLGLGAVVRRRK